MLGLEWRLGLGFSVRVSVIRVGLGFMVRLGLGRVGGRQLPASGQRGRGIFY